MKVLEFAGKHPVVSVLIVWSLVGLANTAINAIARSRAEK